MKTKNMIVFSTGSLSRTIPMGISNINMGR